MINLIGHRWSAIAGHFEIYSQCAMHHCEIQMQKKLHGITIHMLTSKQSVYEDKRTNADMSASDMFPKTLNIMTKLFYCDE